MYIYIQRLDMTRLMIYYDIHWISSDSCHVAENMFAWSCRRQKNSWRPIRPGKMDYAMWYIVIRSKMRELLTLQAHQVIHKAIVWRLPVSPSTHDTSCIPKNACTFVSHQLQLPSSWIPQGSPQEAHFHVAKIWQGLKGRQTRTWPARMVARHSSWPSRWLQNLPMVINCPCKGPIYDSHFELCWRMSSSKKWQFWDVWRCFHEMQNNFRFHHWSVSQLQAGHYNLVERLLQVGTPDDTFVSKTCCGQQQFALLVVFTVFTSMTWDLDT